MKGPTNSEVLWQKIHLAERRLFAATHVFWNHPDMPRLLPGFLIQAHCLMRNSITLMTVARDLTRAQSATDAVARELADYMGIHVEEERGHDRWLLEDIQTLGFEEQEILQSQPCAAVVNLIGAQYFWMTHVHPVAIMGYMILMEGYAPVTSQLEDIRVRSGAPASAFRCLQRHAEDDPGHLADLNRTLDSMALTVAQSRAVGMCAFAAIEGLAAMFEELLEGGATEHRKDLQHAGA
jgi:pyrroloquinoline quinone (PQQ) biosynthesis protein C